MIDPITLRLPEDREGSESVMDERFVSRFPCILATPKKTSHDSDRYAAFVVQAWQACVEWLRTAECNTDQASLIRMLAAAGDRMQMQIADHASVGPLTAREARLAVFGETHRVPIYGMLLHLATDTCPPTRVGRIRPLAAQLLLAYATLIYHDEGIRIDLCKRDEVTEPPVPSAIPACRLVRQMAIGQHAELVDRLPIPSHLLSKVYDEFNNPDFPSRRARYQAGLDALRVTFRYARAHAKRRSRGTGERNPPKDPEPNRSGSSSRIYRSKSIGGTEALLTSALSAEEASAYAQDGLSGIEVRPAREILRSTHTKGEVPGASLPMRIRCQQGMLRDRARANQNLPIRREMIRREELAHLVSELQPWMGATHAPALPASVAHAEGLLLLAMILATGASPEDLHEIPIVRHEDAISEGRVHALVYGPESLYLWVRVPMPKLDPGRYSDVSDLLHPVSEGLWLPLPAQLRHLLSSIRRSAGTRGVRTLFCSDLREIEAAATAVLQTMNAQHHCQLRLTRLPTVLPQIIAERTGNWSYAWILCGEGDPAVHTPLVYQTTPATTLVAAYIGAVTEIFGFPGDTSEDFFDVTEEAYARRYYGSALKPLNGVWAEIARELREMIPPCPPRRSGITEHVEHHNALVLYTLIMALVGTGLRAIRDPVESTRDIDWEHGLLFVVDKESHARGNERIIPLASPILVQLRAYRRHLQGLAERMATRDPTVTLTLRAADSGEDPGVPFLFLLDADLHPSPVRPATIQPRFRSVFPAPLNLGRHHIRTHLTERGCPDEWIEALMGHEPTGMEAFGPYSALSIADLRRLAEHWIEPMLQEQGWVVVEGVPA